MAIPRLPGKIHAREPVDNKWRAQLPKIPNFRQIDNDDGSDDDSLPHCVRNFVADWYVFLCGDEKRLTKTLVMEGIVFIGWA